MASLDQCSRCRALKDPIDFTRQSGSKMKVFFTCNACADQKKKSKAVSYDMDHTRNQDTTENDYLEIIIIDDEDRVWFNLRDLENLVSNCFENIDENGYVNFSRTFKFDDELINYISSKDQESNKEKIYHDIAKFLHIPIESGSHYYWELRKVYAHKKNNQLVGEAMIYLGCMQREDRKRTHSDSYIVKKIKLYRMLCEERLIDPNIHTYQQVYYWASKFSAQKYVINISNQLLSAHNFLKRNELNDQGYKILLYVENDFIRCLGFTTPFMQYIPKNKITEIIIDSTFKTNQEKFELFSILNNLLALKEFFSLLKAEGIQLCFVLVDKDAGEISALGATWSTKIQLCLWHIECAIERKLKEKNIRLVNIHHKRHDYPLIFFGKKNLPSIVPENILWNEITKDSLSKIENIDDVELNLHYQNKLIEDRKIELEEDKKVFESLLVIVLDNIQNDHFYNAYKKIRQTLVTEVIACQEALTARRQQKTWNPPRGSKLAF
ncbi:7575_t:CDS:2 [Cetraspora pellucida]|uniref:7575_t:CDS:1 n=1 Tax=Cetraspora pellucida TaxID=1433469 RepID=A0ACA9NY53_9GLOM|nr:7575_t:CDS:2 [Cetraspora pellucida]